MTVLNVYPSMINTKMLDTNQYGMQYNKIKFPHFLKDEPKTIVLRIIKGIKKDKKFINPSFISYIACVLYKFFPHLLQRIRKIIKV